MDKRTETIVCLHLFWGARCFSMSSLKHNLSVTRNLLSTEKQVHAVAVVGAHCPKFVEKLREQLDKRELKVCLNVFHFCKRLKLLTIQIRI